MRRSLVLLLIIILSSSSLLAVQLVQAQSIPKPSVPDFTVKAIASAIEVTVKNQPLFSFENGSYPSLYYMFRFKDHNAPIGFWSYDPTYFVLPSTYGGYYKATDSDFTAVSLSLEGYSFPSGQVDIQAVALVGNQYPTNMQNGTVYGFEGVTSDWSSTQTIKVAELPLQDFVDLLDSFLPIIALVVLGAGVALVVASVFLYRSCRKVSKIKSLTSN